jgi:aminopeptidase N
MDTPNMTKILRKDYLPPEFTVNYVSLDFNIVSETQVEIITLLEISRLDSSATNLRLNGSKFLKLEELRINDILVSSDGYSFSKDDLIIPILFNEQYFSLRTKVLVNPLGNKTLEGLYASSSIITTQCEAEGFRKITYHMDRPDVLAIYNVTITAPVVEFPVLLSNGNLINQSTFTRGGTQYSKSEFSDPHPKPSYLFALVAGKLASIKGEFTTKSGRLVELAIFSEPKNVTRCDFAMEALKRSMKWEEDIFGLECDLDNYNIVAIDDFNAGAMENKGLNIFNSSYVLADPTVTTDTDFKYIDAVVAHEYFHNYTGNRVTCRSWFELTLKEGLTVFRDAMYSKDFDSKTNKLVADARVIREHQFKEDRGPDSHPIRPDEVGSVDNFYTSTVYDKGAEIIRMVETIVGREALITAVKYYLNKHDGQAVTCNDFILSVEESTGRDLAQFYKWYEQNGTPVVNISRSYNEDTKILTLEVNQGYLDGNDCEITPLMIPCNIAMFDEYGVRISFVDIDGIEKTETVLIINEVNQTFEFSSVLSAPLLSCFRDFSAPIIYKSDLTLSELAILATSETDGFVKFESAQAIILKAINNFHSDEIYFDTTTPEVMAVSVIKSAIQQFIDGDIEAGLLDSILTPPPISFVASDMDEYDPFEIKKAIEYFNRLISHELSSELSALLRHIELLSISGKKINEHVDFDYRVAEIRSLKNKVIYYLFEKDISLINNLSKEKTFTDQASAFSKIMNSSKSKELKDSNSLDFYNKWNKETTALDLWFSVVCGADDKDSLSRLKEIINIKEFIYTNPNIISSTIGSYSHSLYFHNLNGEGYYFIADWIKKLDKINPQAASKLFDGFSDVKRMGNVRKKIVIDIFRNLLLECESDNVLEKLRNSLKDFSC